MKYRIPVYLLVLIMGFSQSIRAEGQTPIDQAPMYGGMDRATVPDLKAADDKLIADVTSHFGTREKASIAFWRDGDVQMERGNVDIAMKRYNQSWLLNPNNYQPYWGFGRVTAQQKKPDEALRYLEKSLQLINDPYQKVALLTDIAMVYSEKAFYSPDENTKERARLFALANQNFEESSHMDAGYPNVWHGWARSLYLEGKYADAWDKVKKARALKADFSLKFIKSLEEKLPEPK